MESALLTGLPVEMLKELALHALQSQKVTIDAIVDELVKLVQKTGALRKVPEPWRSIALRVERPLLTFVIREIVELAEAELQEAGVLPKPEPASA